jgi:hypothetical protein
MRASLIAIVTIIGTAGALADDRAKTGAPRVRGVFGGEGAVVCEEPQTSPRRCTAPCTTWARAQPDFQYSFAACIANCRQQLPCAGR